jgi:hypothetical protein
MEDRVVSRLLSRTTFQGPEGHNSIEGDEGCSASQRCSSSESSSLQAEISMPLKRTGSGDMNEETHISFSIGFCSERGFALGFSKHELVVVDADFLSFFTKAPLR